MTRTKTEVALDTRLLDLIDERADATGRPRSEVIEEALRQQLTSGRFAELVEEVRSRSDLTEQQALELAYSELDAVRAERSTSA